MKLIDLLRETAARLVVEQQIPPKHTGEVTVILQLNQGGVRDGRLIVAKAAK